MRIYHRYMAWESAFSASHPWLAFAVSLAVVMGIGIALVLSAGDDFQACNPFSRPCN